MYFQNLCRITFLLGVVIGPMSWAMSVGGDASSNSISDNTISDTSDKGAAVTAVAITNSPPVQTNEPQTPLKFTRYHEFNHNISVSWEVDVAKEKVYFHVVAKTLGWIGFGLSPSGSMEDADLIIGGVDSKGAFYFSDRSIKERHSNPSIDAEQNWYLTWPYQGHGQTELKFWRHFDTGDEQDDLIISNMETNFIWAFGLTDVISQHGMDRGSAKVNILTPPQPKFTRFMELNEKFAVSWEVDNVQEKVTFEVIAKTLGWVGFGLSVCGSMKNADLVIGGVGPNNTFYFADRYVGERNSMPTIDKQQDWHIISSYEGHGQTELKFWRYFKTGDSADLDILNQETHFLWAIGETDEIQQHGTDRGSDHVNILEPPPLHFNRSLQLNDKVYVSWEVDNIEEKVVFEVIANTTGWIGFGISTCGSMNNSDIIIGGVYPNNSIYFSDRIVRERDPIIDTKQNWFLLGGSEQDGQTTLKFWRYFHTGDKLEDIPILNKETHFVWAIGMSDEIKQHRLDERGSDHVNILDPTPVDHEEDHKPDSIKSTTSIPTEINIQEFTVATLGQFNGQTEGQPIYMAVNSKVFDVSKGRTFYSPGGSYSHYAGRDASRALATGNRANVSDDFDELSDLTVAERQELEFWDAFYVKKYPVIGRLVRS